MGSLYQKIKLISDRPHILYSAVAMLVALAFAVITPPFHGPDEDVHFFRAYQIAQGDIIMERQGDDLGTCLSVEIYSAVVDSSLTPNVRGLTTHKYDIGQVKSEILNPVDDPAVCRFVSTTNTYTYNPIAYAPAVIGVSMVNFFNGPPLLAMYLARFITVVMTVGLSALAIKLIPKRKHLLTIILLTPMMLYQQSVISVDGLSYAVLAVFVAYVIRLYGLKGGINKRQWATVSVLAIALCCMKPLLFMFTPLVLLLLPIDKLKPLVIIATCLAVLGIASLSTNSLYSGVSSVGAAGSNAEQQAEGLMESPLRALQVAWNTYMSPYGDSQTAGIIGLFGYADTKIPLWVYTAAVINIVLVTIFASANDFNRRIRNVYKAGAALLMALYFVAVNAAMYIAYSPVGESIFYGVQGRYFLPLLILIPVLATHGLVLRAADMRKLQGFTLISTIVVLTLCLVVVFQRYYLYTP